MEIDTNAPSSVTQTVSLTMSSNTDAIPGNNQQSSTITVVSQGQ